MNINDIVRVKLTDEGIRVYKKTIEDLRLPDRIETDIFERLEENDGYFISSFWDLMNVFGPEMYMGNVKQMFVNNHIDIMRDGQWVGDLKLQPSEEDINRKADALCKFMNKAGYLSHPDVVYHGTCNGDSPEDWAMRVYKKAVETVLNA